MATECQLPYTQEDKEMLDEAANRVWELSPEILERDLPEIEKIVAEKEAAIQKKIEKVTSLIGAEPIKDVLLVHDKPPNTQGEPTQGEIEELKERILAADPRSAIIPLGNRELPSFFTSGFKDTGEEITAQLTDYPEDFPKVMVYSPAQPTLENLGLMLDRQNPFNPWGEKAHFHHLDQKPDQLMQIGEKLHQGATKELHDKKALSDEAREKYENQQRPDIVERMVKEYLGKYADCKEIRDALIEKAREMRDIRRQARIDRATKNND